MNEEILLENENGIPENWETNTIYIRNENGEIVKVEVPDDKEE